MTFTKIEYEALRGVYNGLGVSPCPAALIGLTHKQTLSNGASLQKEIEICDVYELDITKLEPFIQTEINRKLQALK